MTFCITGISVLIFVWLLIRYSIMFEIRSIKASLKQTPHPIFFEQARKRSENGRKMSKFQNTTFQNECELYVHSAEKVKNKTNKRIKRKFTNTDRHPALPKIFQSKSNKQTATKASAIFIINRRQQRPNPSQRANPVLKHSRNPCTTTDKLWLYAASSQYGCVWMQHTAKRRPANNVRRCKERPNDISESQHLT